MSHSKALLQMIFDFPKVGYVLWRVGKLPATVFFFWILDEYCRGSHQLELVGPRESIEALRFASVMRDHAAHLWGLSQAVIRISYEPGFLGMSEGF